MNFFGKSKQSKENEIAQHQEQPGYKILNPDEKSDVKNQSQNQTSSAGGVYQSQQPQSQGYSSGTNHQSSENPRSTQDAHYGNDKYGSVVTDAAYGDSPSSKQTQGRYNDTQISSGRGNQTDLPSSYVNQFDRNQSTMPGSYANAGQTHQRDHNFRTSSSQQSGSSDVASAGVLAGVAGAAGAIVGATGKALGFGGEGEGQSLGYNDQQKLESENYGNTGVNDTPNSYNQQQYGTDSSYGTKNSGTSGATRGGSSKYPQEGQTSSTAGHQIVSDNAYSNDHNSSQQQHHLGRNVGIAGTTGAVVGGIAGKHPGSTTSDNHKADNRQGLGNDYRAIDTSASDKGVRRDPQLYESIDTSASDRGRHKTSPQNYETIDTSASDKRFGQNPNSYNTIDTSASGRGYGHQNEGYQKARDNQKSSHVGTGVAGGGVAAAGAAYAKHHHDQQGIKDAYGTGSNSNQGNYATTGSKTGQPQGAYATTDSKTGKGYDSSNTNTAGKESGKKTSGIRTGTGIVGTTASGQTVFDLEHGHRDYQDPNANRGIKTTTGQGYDSNSDYGSKTVAGVGAAGVAGTAAYGASKHSGQTFGTNEPYSSTKSSDTSSSSPGKKSKFKIFGAFHDSKEQKKQDKLQSKVTGDRGSDKTYDTTSGTKHQGTGAGTGAAVGTGAGVAAGKHHQNQRVDPKIVGSQGAYGNAGYDKSTNSPQANYHEDKYVKDSHQQFGTDKNVGEKPYSTTGNAGYGNSKYGQDARGPGKVGATTTAAGVAATGAGAAYYSSKSKGSEAYKTGEKTLNPSHQKASSGTGYGSSNVGDTNYDSIEGTNAGTGNYGSTNKNQTVGAGDYRSSGATGYAKSSTDYDSSHPSNIAGTPRTTDEGNYYTGKKELGQVGTRTDPGRQTGSRSNVESATAGVAGLGIGGASQHDPNQSYQSEAVNQRKSRSDSHGLIDTIKGAVFGKKNDEETGAYENQDYNDSTQSGYDQSGNNPTDAGVAGATGAHGAKSAHDNIQTGHGSKSGTSGAGFDDKIGTSGYYDQTGYGNKPGTTGIGYGNNTATAGYNNPPGFATKADTGTAGTTGTTGAGYDNKATTTGHDVATGTAAGAAGIASKKRSHQPSGSLSDVKYDDKRPAGGNYTYDSKGDSNTYQTQGTTGKTYEVPKGMVPVGDKVEPKPGEELWQDTLTGQKFVKRSI